MSLYDYRGTDRRGTARIGRIALPDGTEDLAAWVKRQFRNGWQSLTVAYHGHPLAVVGEIGADYDDPTKRAWWAEG